MAERTGSGSWRNWAGSASAEGIDVLAPADTEEVARAVGTAARTGRKVRPIGSGHSFSPVGVPVDLQLRLHRLRGIVAHDPATHRVRVRAGTRLRELNVMLHALGLAMPNLGDIDTQTLAGAISTGTHGTGIGLPGLAGFVRGVEMVCADGQVRRFDDAHEPGLVPAVAVGLGALGVVTEYELACVPAFHLRAQERPERFEAVLEELDERVEGSDHFEMYLFPHTGLVQTKTDVRVPDTQRAPLPRWRELLDDRLLANTVYEQVNRVTTRLPRTIPVVNALAARALSGRTYTDHSYRVFATQRTVRFRETELSVPREQGAEVLRELHRYLMARRRLVGFPLEVRFTAADDRWLSTSYGRASMYLAVHQYHRVDERPWFRDVWAMVDGLGTRPHWGKMHELGAAELRSRYERFDDFVALRDRLDPQRVFTNPHLDRVLGA